MTDINIIFGAAFLLVLVGGMWSSYRLGFREGTAKMIDFCKSKKNKQGFVLMHFFGENIEFMDALDYNRAVLDAITNEIKDNNEQSS